MLDYGNSLMITIINKQRSISIDTKKLQSIAKAMLAVLGYDDFDLGIWLTTDKTIRRYNQEYRGKDKATDILSFPYHTELKAGDNIIVSAPEDRNMGDIIISLAYVERKASDWGRSFEEHLIALLAHGIAHLLNYDHQTDEEFEVMQKVEKKLLGVVT